MTRQAGVFGAVGLSRAADIANRALTEMTGATSPRLHLELMTARMLVPESDDTQRGHSRGSSGWSGASASATLAAPGRAGAVQCRVERRGGLADSTGAGGCAVVGCSVRWFVAPAAAPVAPASAPAAPAPSVPAPGTAVPTASAPVGTPAADAPEPVAAGAGVDPGAAARAAAASWAAAVPSAPTPQDDRTRLLRRGPVLRRQRRRHPPRGPPAPRPPVRARRSVTNRPSRPSVPSGSSSSRTRGRRSSSTCSARGVRRGRSSSPRRSRR